MNYFSGILKIKKLLNKFFPLNHDWSRPCVSNGTMWYQAQGGVGGKRKGATWYGVGKYRLK